MSDMHLCPAASSTESPEPQRISGIHALPCTSIASIVHAAGSLFGLGTTCEALADRVLFSRFLDTYVQHEFRTHLPSISSAVAGMSSVPAKYILRAVHINEWDEVNKAVDNLHYSAHFAHIATLKLRGFFVHPSTRPELAAERRVLSGIHACLIRILRHGARIGDPEVDPDAQLRRLTAEVVEVSARAEAVLEAINALRDTLPDAQVFEDWIQLLRRSVLDFRAFPVDDEQFRECLYRLRWFMYWKKCFLKMHEDSDEVVTELQRMHSSAERCLKACNECRSSGADSLSALEFPRDLCLQLIEELQSPAPSRSDTLSNSLVSSPSQTSSGGTGSLYDLPVRSGNMASQPRGATRSSSEPAH